MIVRWTLRALQEWEKVVFYIHQEFGSKAVERFEKDIEKWESRIGMNPEVGRPEPLLQGKLHLYRGVILGKHNKMVYYAEDDVVWVVAVWDMRREPCRLGEGLC